MTAKTLERTTFTPTKDPSVWYASSRTRPGVTYRMERVGYPDMWCACPATKRCAHLKELADMLALVPAPAPAPKDEWNDIAPAPVRSYFFTEPTAPPVRVPEPPKGKPMSGFVKATKEQSKLRMALIGPSGSGKTYTALAIAKHLNLGKIAFIDTERGSASKYAHEFDFDVLTLDPPFTIEKYIEAIRMAGDAGYGVLIIDSLSHAWAGAGGMLEYVDNRKKSSGGKDGFSAWGDATPKQNHFIDSILGSNCHVIATMRSKMTYVQAKDERTGKTAIEKHGLQPIQRDGVEYEFDIIGDLDEHNTLRITKTRASSLSEYVADKAGAELAGMIRSWLLDGVAAKPDAPEVKKATYPWGAAMKAALAKSPYEVKDMYDHVLDYLAAHLPYAIDDPSAAIDDYLTTTSETQGRKVTAHDLVNTVVDWVGAGRPDVRVQPATARSPKTAAALAYVAQNHPETFDAGPTADMASEAFDAEDRMRRATETFDEGEYTDPSAEPALFDMPSPEPQRAAPGRHG